MPNRTCGEETLAITAYPIIATGRVKSMIMPRSFKRSDRNATHTGQLLAIDPRGMLIIRKLPVTGVATAYGMTDQSCVSFALEVILRSLIIVGSCYTASDNAH